MKFGGKNSPYKAGKKRVLKKGYRFAKGGRVVKVKAKARRRRCR